MANRELVYKVRIDASQAAQSAAQVRATIQRELNNISIMPRLAGGASTAGLLRGATGSGTGSSTLDRLAGGVVGGLTGYLSVQGIQQLGQTVLALDREATAYGRVKQAAVELAGSQEQLTGLLRAYEEASGGAIDKATALADVTRLQAVGFADSAAELTRFVTAARGASIATGSPVEYLQGQLQLAIANQSMDRLDQIGLGAAEVTGEMERLMAANQGMTREAAYQEAVLGRLIAKYGELATSGAGLASGQELATTALRDARLELALTLQQYSDPIMREAAVSFGSDNLPNLRQVFQQRMDQLGDGSSLERNNYAAAARAIDAYSAALKAGDPHVDRYRARLVELAQAAAGEGGRFQDLTKEIDELTRVITLSANGGIRYAAAMDEVSQANARLAASQDVVNSTFERALQLYSTNVAGQMYRNMGPGLPSQPVTPLGPQLPSADYLRWQEVRAGGGFLSPGGQSLGDIRSRWGAQYSADQEQKTLKAQREAEAAGERAARQAETAWERAAANTERAFRNAADELQGKLEQIPGLFGASDVTQAQVDLAKMGVPQNFADDYRRRLNDEVLNGVQYDDVDIFDAARRGGIDPTLDPKAILALFNQRWADSSLFANPENLSLLNQSAITDALAQQKASETGRANLLGMFGLGTDSQGTYFVDGMVGAMAGVGDAAIQELRAQMSSEAAISQYTRLGETAGAALFDGISNAIGQGNLVAMITGAVLEQLSAELESNP